MYYSNTSSSIYGFVSAMLPFSDLQNKHPFRTFHMHHHQCFIALPLVTDLNIVDSLFFFHPCHSDVIKR